jgi:hypothetical protein
LVDHATILDDALKPRIRRSAAAWPHKLTADIRELVLHRKTYINFSAGKVLRLRLGILNRKKKDPGSPSLRMTERGNYTAAGTAAATSEVSA